MIRHHKKNEVDFARPAAIEIVNRQRKHEIEEASLIGFAEQAARQVWRIATQTGSEIVIAFVSERAMRELNQRFRGKNKVTDVLSFRAGTNDEADVVDDTDLLGEIVICAARAARQASENDLSFDGENRQLILHGILHLCGFDHDTDDGEMNRIELQLRKRLKI